MKTKYKIIVYVLVVSLLISMFSFPASADAEWLQYADLLTAPEYFFRSPAGSGPWITLDHPGVEGASRAQIEFCWYVGDRSSDYAYCYFTVRSSLKPSSVAIAGSEEDYYANAVYVGGTNGLYQYYAALPNDLDYMYLKAGFSSLPGTFEIISFTGVYSAYESITNAYLYWYTDYIAAESVSREQWLFEYIALPYGNTHLREDSAVSSWATDEIFIDVTDADRQFNFADSITFLIEGSSLNNFECALYKSGSVSDIVPVSTERVCAFPGSDMSEGESDYDWSPCVYKVVCDLSGYNLSGVTISLSFYITPDKTMEGFKDTYFFLYDAWITPHIDPVPWYQTFWNWLWNGLKSLSNNTLTAIGNIGNMITDAWQFIVESVEAGTHQIVSRLDELISGGEAGQAMSDAGASLQEQAGAMNDANAALDEATIPDWDSDSFFNDYLHFDTGGMAILSAITSSPQIGVMMSVVFTLALIGFVFFGKRG